jgi:phage gpG-like protein
MAADGYALFEGKEAEEFLDHLREKYQTISRGSKALAGILATPVFRDVVKHFEEERGPEGGWPEWSSVYAEHMDKIGKGGNKILQDTGRLRQSYMISNYRASSEGVVFYNPAKTKGGFPYAQAHDEGGGKLPQRKFMWLSDVAMESVAEQTLQWMTDASRPE